MGGREREKNINPVSPSCSLLGMEPETWACAPNLRTSWFLGQCLTNEPHHSGLKFLFLKLNFFELLEKQSGQLEDKGNQQEVVIILLEASCNPGPLDFSGHFFIPQ